MTGADPDNFERLHPKRAGILPDNISNQMQGVINDAFTAIHLAILVQSAMQEIEETRNARLISQFTRLDAYEARKASKILRENARKLREDARKVHEALKYTQDAAHH